MDADTYVNSVLERLRAAEFREEAPPEGAVLKARRKRLSLTRLGVVETVVVVSTTRPNATSEQLETFGRASVQAAMEGKVKLPRGVGSSLVVYPVLVTSGTSDELTQFVESHFPKHWSMLEFPVVVPLEQRRLTFATKTPVWGSAYYRKTRSEAEQLLAPISSLM